MTNVTRSTDDIETEIEAERAQSSGSINDPQQKFSVERILPDLGAMVQGQGAMGRSILTSISSIPAAVALVGVGQDWMFISKRRDASSNRQDRHDGLGGRSTRALPGRTTAGSAADSRWFDDGGAVEDLPRSWQDPALREGNGKHLPDPG